MIRALSLAACLLCTLCLSAKAADRALLIGIDAYPKDPLYGAVNDVNAMERIAIEQFGFDRGEVMVLRDGQATTDGIRKAISSWLIQGSGPGDRVLLYFAGHGIQVADGANRDETDDGFDEALVPVDFDGTPERLLIDDELAIYLDALANRRVTVIIDACHSGTVHRSINNIGGHRTARYLPRLIPVASRGVEIIGEPKQMRQDEGLLDGADGRLLEVWTASAAYQETYDERINGVTHGVFTRGLIEAITSNAADRDRNGRTSRNEVLGHLRGRAQRFCAKHAANAICTLENGLPTLTPTLLAGPPLRALEIAEWPGAGGTTLLPKSEPLETVEDIVTGGSFTANLLLEGLKGESGASLRPRDPFRVRITSDLDGQLLLLRLTEAGKLSVVFPSEQYAKDSRVTAGRPYLLPDALQQVSYRYPSGKGALIAVVTPDRPAVEALLNTSRSLKVVPDGQGADQLGVLMAKLTDVFRDGAENRGIRYGVAVARYGAR